MLSMFNQNISIGTKCRIGIREQNALCEALSVSQKNKSSDWMLELLMSMLHLHTGREILLSKAGNQGVEGVNKGQKSVNVVCEPS